MKSADNSEPLKAPDAEVNRVTGQKRDGPIVSGSAGKTTNPDPGFPSIKYQILCDRIRKRGSMLVSFSGGVDSSLLAVLSKEILGENSRCVLLTSPVVPESAIIRAGNIAREYALTLDVLEEPVMDSPGFRENSSMRCYHCRKTGAAVLHKRAEELGFSCIADGVNATDTGEYRPGIVATREEGIVHPFLDAGITKKELRVIARERGFSFWNTPSTACLSSRIPYGEEITREKLRRIESAEEYLKSFGLSQVRVRSHGPLARIEILEEEMPHFLPHRREIATVLKNTGFTYITLDLEGFRSGSMNEVL